MDFRAYLRTEKLKQMIRCGHDASRKNHQNELLRRKSVAILIPYNKLFCNYYRSQNEKKA